MKTKERIYNAIIFELLALVIVVPTATIFSDKDASSMMVVTVGLSLYAVFWNFIYNIWFDRQFGGERVSRTLLLRTGHTFGFEFGIIFVTVPLVAWFLEISLSSALLMEMAFLIFFFFYAIVFNWCYDNFHRQMID